MKFTLRKVDIADPAVQEAIASLDDEIFADEILNPKREKTGAWWIVYAGKDVAAYAGIKPSVRTPQCGYFCRVGVLPPYRGQGLQRRLIDVRSRYARAQGWNQVVTDTYIENYPSANSLIACGFRLYKPPVPWVPSRYLGTTLFWRKAL